MNINKLNLTLLLLSLLSISNLSSFSATKNTKLDSKELQPNTKLDNSFLLEVKNIIFLKKIKF